MTSPSHLRGNVASWLYVLYVLLDLWEATAMRTVPTIDHGTREHGTRARNPRHSNPGRSTEPDRPTIVRDTQPRERRWIGARDRVLRPPLEPEENPEENPRAREERARDSLHSSDGRKDDARHSIFK